MALLHYFTLFFSANTACIFLCALILFKSSGSCRRKKTTKLKHDRYKILRIILSLSLIFQPVFSHSEPEYVPICIDSEFNLATGTFGPPDPSLCGKAKRWGEGTGKTEGSGEGAGGEGTDNSNSGRIGNPSSPMNQSLGEWSDERDRRANQTIEEMKSYRQAYISHIFEQVTKEAEIKVTGNILEELKKNFFSVEVIDEQWLKKIDEHSGKIHLAVKYLMYEKLSHLITTALLDRHIRNVTEGIKIEVHEEIADFRIKTLTKEKMRELGKLFLDSNRHSDWIRETERIIDKAASQMNSPLYRKLIMEGSEYSIRKQKLESHTRDIEQILYRTAKQLAERHILKPFEKNLSEGMDSLNEKVIDTVQSTENINMRPLFRSNAYELYTKNVREVAKESLKLKHDRRELAFLSDTKLSESDEAPYEFQSPEGEFLEKNKTLYEKLRNANPYHEQGVRAREIGLAAVEVADQEYSAGNEPEATLAYQIGEGMAGIALGVMPYVGLGKDVYEAFTGKHLLTGRSLSNLERSFAVVGVVISGISGGLFSSSAIKLTLKNTDTVLSKINKKLLEKSLQGLRESQFKKIVKQYPTAVLKAIRDIGADTRQSINSTVHFLKKAFAGSHSSIEEIVRTIKHVKKSGIENYTNSLEELAAKGIKLPEAGEGFLARQLRFGKQLQKTELVKTGEVYSLAEKHLGTTIKPISFPKSDQTGEIWRAVRVTGEGGSLKKSFENTENTVFDFHPGMLSEEHRYSPIGKSALFTSLDKETALKEFTKQQKGTNTFTQPSYIIKSKTVTNIDQVLDLTDNKTVLENGKKQLKTLKISPGDLIKNAKKISDAYTIPNLIREVAERKGFKAILAPSSVNKKKTNLIILSDKVLK